MYYFIYKIVSATPASAIDEVKRIHPGERFIIKDGYLKVVIDDRSGKYLNPYDKTIIKLRERGPGDGNEPESVPGYNSNNANGYGLVKAATAI